MRKIHALVPFVLAMTFTLPATGDITPMWGSGGALYPEGSDKVTMKSGKVVITADATEFYDLCNEYWHYECTFELENTSKKKASLTVGFPVPDYQSASGAPDDPDGVVYDTGMEGFTATVDGEPVDVTPEEDIPSAGGDDETWSLVYIWPMTIPAGKTTTVVVEYDFPSLCNPKYGIYEGTLEYILTSGAMWKGPIGVFDIEVQFLDHLIYAEGRSDDEEGEIDAGAVPPGEIQGSGVDTVMVWHMEDWTPTEDFFLTYRTGSLERIRVQASIWKSRDVLDTQGDIQEALDILWASLGKTFEDPEKQAAFEKEPWYLPNPELGEDVDALTEAGAAYADLISDLETRLETAPLEDPDAGVPVVVPSTEKHEIEKRGGCACEIAF